jgi:hypothetical protein
MRLLYTVIVRATLKKLCSSFPKLPLLLTCYVLHMVLLQLTATEPAAVPDDVVAAVADVLRAQAPSLQISEDGNKLRCGGLGWCGVGSGRSGTCTH